MEAWLLSQGYRLYEEILLPLPPLLVQPLAWLFHLTGPSSVAARWLEIAYAGVGLVAIACLGRKLWTTSSGWLAAVILSIAPGYFRLSRFSLGNVPATALGIFSLYGGWLYFEHGRRRWLILAGLIASTGLLIKPLSVAVPFLLVGLVIVRHGRAWRVAKTTDNKSSQPSGCLQEAIIDGLLLMLALALPLALAFLTYHTPAMVNQLIIFRYRLAQSQTQDQDIFFNLQRLWQFLSNNAGLSLLAVAGLCWLLFGSKRKGGWFILAWLGLSLVSIVGYQSLQRHHLILLEPPLALLAVLAIDETARSLFGFSKHNRLPVKLIAWFSLAVILFYLGTLPTIISDHLSTRPQGLTWDDDRERWQAVKLLQELTSAEQFVLSDDLAIPFEARRRVPPWLSDPSRAVIEAGYIDQKTAIQVADRQAAAVLFWSGRFREELPIFTWWVENNFTQSVAVRADRVIYFNKQPPTISFPNRVDLGGILRFEGYDLTYQSEADRVNLSLTLYWRKLEETDIDYAVTVRALDDAGQRVAQVDGQFFQGYFPTGNWPVGVLFWDTIVVEIPLTDTSSVKNLAVGVYNPDTLQLLTIPNSVDDLLLLPLKM